MVKHIYYNYKSDYNKRRLSDGYENVETVKQFDDKLVMEQYRSCDIVRQPTYKIKRVMLPRYKSKVGDLMIEILERILYKQDIPHIKCVNVKKAELYYYFLNDDK